MPLLIHYLKSVLNPRGTTVSGVFKSFRNREFGMNFHLFSTFAPISRLGALVLWEGFVHFDNDQCTAIKVWLEFVPKIKRLLLMNLQSLNILSVAALVRIEHTEG